VGTEQTPIIQGSWEDLLLQAQQLAAKQDDDAIAIYQKLTDRLSRLPAPQRQVGDGRLQGVMRQAAVDLQYYLSFRDRYDEALAVNEKIRILLSGPEQKAFVRHAAAIRLQAGDIDGGLGDLQAIATLSEELDPWGDVLFAALDKRRFAEAQEAIQSAEAWVNHRHRGALDSEEAKRDGAFVAYLKARQAAAQGQGPEALAWQQFAAALDPFYRHNPQYVYTHLVDVGAYAEAQTLIRTDREGVIRASFWQGLILFRQGKAPEAEAAWRKAVGAELPQDGNVDYLELVLSHYYLGDHDGVGLASVLRAINEDPGFWGMFYLAGLGWAMRNDMVTARSDMQLALVRRKSLAEGRKLSRTWWQFCADLLDESKQTQLVEYFEDAQIQRRA
jgi:tetratricopeptide (TPR) repeat protein